MTISSKEFFCFEKCTMEIYSKGFEIVQWKFLSKFLKKFILVKVQWKFLPKVWKSFLKMMGSIGRANLFTGVFGKQ